MAPSARAHDIVRRRPLELKVYAPAVMEDTWTGRDLPVLAALVERFDDPAVDQMRPAEIAALVTLDEATVLRALTALCEAQPAYLDCVSIGEQRAPVIVTGVTALARQAVGSWPSPEALVDRLVAALTLAAEHEDDPERKSKLQQAALWFGGALRDVAVQVAATVVARSIGL